MDAHLSQFYGTNHVPSDAELLEVEKLLAPYNSRLSQLEKDLKEAESKVARLKKEQEDRYNLRISLARSYAASYRLHNVSFVHNTMADLDDRNVKLVCST